MERPDRRRYFRIDDLVGLSYEVLDIGSPDGGARQADQVQITAVDLLRSIDLELTEALNTLWQTSPTAANAIGLLNKKVDILSAEMDLDYGRIKGIAAPTQQVNLSACGMAFRTLERFDVGQVLALTLVLKPANTLIKLNGRVVGCDWLDEEMGRAYLLRVDFDRVSLSIEEQLIQHIVRRQSAQRGRARQVDDA